MPWLRSDSLEHLPLSPSLCLPSDVAHVVSVKCAVGAIGDAAHCEIYRVGSVRHASQYSHGLANRDIGHSCIWRTERSLASLASARL